MLKWTADDEMRYFKAENSTHSKDEKSIHSNGTFLYTSIMAMISLRRLYMTAQFPIMLYPENLQTKNVGLAQNRNHRPLIDGNLFLTSYC